MTTPSPHDSLEGLPRLSSPNEALREHLKPHG